MSQLSFLVFCVSLFASGCIGAISDKRLCGDPTCSDAVSQAKTLIRYVSDDDRILSFQGNIDVKVFSKSAGSRPDLWGVEINGKRGYAPKDFIREYKIVKGKLDYIVSTGDEEASSLGETPQLPEISNEKQDSQVDEPADKKEESTSDEHEEKLTTSPTIGITDKQIENDISSSSETLEPYEVVDGTTFYYSTDVPAESLPILATMTENSIKPTTIQSHPDAASNTGNIDEPNPSMVLPKAATSTDASTEKEDKEGSAEKIYNYLLSNFMPEQGSGEKTKDSDEPEENESDGENIDENSGVKEISPTESVSETGNTSIESTESDRGTKEVHNDAPLSPVNIVSQGDGNPEHREASALPSAADVGTPEKTAHHESAEEEDEDDDESDEDEEFEEEDEVGDEGADEEKNENSKSNSESIEASPGSDSSLPSTENIKMLENQDSNLDDHSSEFEVNNKLEMPNIDEHDTEVVSDDEPSRVETVTESHSKLFGSLDQIGDYLNQAINESNLDLTDGMENHTKLTTGFDITEGSDTSESSIAKESEKEPQVQDSGDGPRIIEDVEETLQHFRAPELNDPIHEHTQKILFTDGDSKLNLDTMTTESMVDQHNSQKSSDTGLDPNSSAEQNVDMTVSNLSNDQVVLLDENDLNQNHDLVQKIEFLAEDQTLHKSGTEISPENEVDDMESDQKMLHELNETNTSPGHETTSVEPDTARTLDNMSPEFDVPVVTDKIDIVPDISKDTPTSNSPTEDSTETIYIDDWSENSSSNVVAEDLDLPTEHISDDTNKDNVETSGGFFSGIASSLFGSFFSGSDPEPLAEPNAPEVVENVVEVNAESADERDKGDASQNSAWSSIWSYSKQPDNAVDNHQPDTSSSCLADSGIDPDCDKVLLPGKEPIVALDNEAAKQTMAEQDPEVPQEDSWVLGDSYDLLSCISIAAVSMVVIVLGHWFIEKMRCNSSVVKRISDLERSLVYAELESKHLKTELKENQEILLGLEDTEKLVLLEEQLLAVIDNSAILEEKIIFLEEKNSGLQSSLDAATEAGLELNRMLSDVLSTNKGSEQLISSVNELQQQLNTQQTTINNMNTVLNSKEAETEGLRNNLSMARETIQSLERELNQLTESLNEVIIEKNTIEDNYKSVKFGLETQIKTVGEKEERMLKEIGTLRSHITQMESNVSTVEVESALLRECVRLLKNDGTDCAEEFKRLLEIAKSEVTCRSLLSQRDHLAEELQEERDARKLLADHVDVTTKEIEKLRKAFEQSEKEKLEAVTKHAVLSDYFKDKESQLHKELGYRDALYMQTKGDATTTHEEVKSLHELLDNYKSQVDTLKKEIMDQERGLKSQILAFEKKSQDNWLAARQAERKLQESKQEAALLRNRLTVVEKNVSNVVQNDKVPISNDRDPLDINLGSPISPPLYPSDMNAALGDTTSPLVARSQPVASSEPLSHGLLSPTTQLGEEVNYRNRSNHASPSLNRLPAPRSLPRMSPATGTDITFTLNEACDPNSPFFGILGPSAPYDPFYGRPIQDRHNPDLYRLVPLLPYITGVPPVILPPPVLPNHPPSHDRRPPPLGRMSSPPVGGRTTPPPPRGRKSSPPRGRLSSPLKRSTPPLHGHTSPPDRRHRRSPPLRGHVSPPPSPRGHRYSPERRHRRSSPQRGRTDSLSPPRGRLTPTRRTSLDRERRGSVGSTSQDRRSPFDSSTSQERGRRKSTPPRGRVFPFDHSNTRGRTPSPERGHMYHSLPRRRRSPSPSGHYSDSSADSTPESRRYARRYDYSPDSSYRGRSRTPSPTSFRPISRQASNNQGSNRSSNQSFESDESNRRGGRV